VTTCEKLVASAQFFVALAVLSITLEVDVPAGKIGGSLLFEHQRRELPSGGLGARVPDNFLNLDAWKCYFQHFPDSIWALGKIKIQTILTIFHVY